MEHNYQNKIIESINEGKLVGHPGKVQILNVYHDDWCNLLKGKGQCNCDPEMKLEDARDDI